MNDLSESDWAGAEAPGNSPICLFGYSIFEGPKMTISLSEIAFLRARRAKFLSVYSIFELEMVEKNLKKMLCADRSFLESDTWPTVTNQIRSSKWHV